MWRVRAFFFNKKEEKEEHAPEQEIARRIQEQTTTRVEFENNLNEVRNFYSKLLENRCITSLMLPPKTGTQLSFPRKTYCVTDRYGEILCGVCNKLLFPPPTTYCVNCKCQIHFACAQASRCAECERKSLASRWFERLYGSSNLMVLLLSCFLIFYLIPVQMVQRVVFPGSLANLMNIIRNLLLFYHASRNLRCASLHFVYPCLFYVLGGFRTDNEGQEQKDHESIVDLLKETKRSSSFTGRVISTFALFLIDHTPVGWLINVELILFLIHLVVLPVLANDYPLRTFRLCSGIFFFRLAGLPRIWDMPFLGPFLTSAGINYAIELYFRTHSESFLSDEYGKKCLLFFTHVTFLKWSTWREREVTQNKLLFSFFIFLTCFFFSGVRWHLERTLRNVFTTLS